MPDSASTPASPWSTQNATSASQSSPAATSSHTRPSLRGSCSTPRVVDAHDRPVEPLVGDDDVAAAREHEHGLAGVVGLAHERRRARPPSWPRRAAAAGRPGAAS